MLMPSRFCRLLWLTVLALILIAPAADADTVFVEAEQFEDHGGWVLDQQFMDLMGSPFLLAHGMGTPVDDATTTLNFATPGKYRVWARTRDWVAPWKVQGAPGKFQLLINGKPLENTLGTEGELWHWQFAGTVDVNSKSTLAIHDLTGFEGRCDAIVFSNDPKFTPTNDPQALETFRRQQLGLPIEPVDKGEFDLVVVGGGMAGTAGAVTAARLGLKVALIQDRPVLGGNASSEVRVWPEGYVNQMPFPRVGDVVVDLSPEHRADSHNAQNAEVFDDDRKLRVAKAEPNITLFLENRMNQAHAENGSIKWVVCQNVRSAERSKIRGRMFLDSTGDASLGYLVGAAFDQTAKGHMGSSNLWNVKCLCEDEDPLSSQLEAACELATFPRCPWAVDLTDKPFPGREDGAKAPQPDADNKPISLGNWFWESGFDRDPIMEMERVRDQNFRAMYGAWDVIKNVEKRYPAHRLNWVAYIAGKRESRRLMGDVVLEASDLRGSKKYPDGCFPCTWGIDTHFPHEEYKEGHDGDEFISDFTHGKQYKYAGPYWVPYRCLYSRNVNNLFMAGRDISTTHEALGAVRVMKTTGAMGEIVGMAAKLCKTKSCSPREVYTNHLEDLKSLMHMGAGQHTPLQADAAGSFTLTTEAATLGGKSVRVENDWLSYWRRPNDKAMWAFETTKAGKYQIELLMACDDENAGGKCDIHLTKIGSSEVPFRKDHKVASTGGWDQFETVNLGTVDLEPGKYMFSMVNHQKGRKALMKLKSVSLGIED
jgi:hypothetical protein